MRHIYAKPTVLCLTFDLLTVYIIEASLLLFVFFDCKRMYVLTVKEFLLSVVVENINLLVIVRPHCSTTYAGAAYCDRQVAWSVRLSRS